MEIEVLIIQLFITESLMTVIVWLTDGGDAMPSRYPPRGSGRNFGGGGGSRGQSVETDVTAGGGGNAAAKSSAPQGPSKATSAAKSTSNDLTSATGTKPPPLSNSSGNKPATSSASGEGSGNSASVAAPKRDPANRATRQNEGRGGGNAEGAKQAAVAKQLVNGQ